MGADWAAALEVGAAFLLQPFTATTVVEPAHNPSSFTANFRQRKTFKRISSSFVQASRFRGGYCGVEAMSHLRLGLDDCIVP